MCPGRRHEFRMSVSVASDGVTRFLADNPGLRVLKPGARDERLLRRAVEGYADYEAPPGPWWTWDAP